MAGEFLLDIDSNVAEVANLLAEIGDKIIKDAHVAATNKAITKARTQIRKEVAAETGVPSKELAKRFKVTRATKRVPRAALFIGTMPVAAIKLKAKAIASGGVSYRGGPSGRIKNKSAFIERMPSGHEGVFVRRGKSRLPITEQRVPIINAARSAADKQVRTVLPQQHRRIYNAEFNFRVGRAIDKRRLRGA